MDRFEHGRKAARWVDIGARGEADTAGYDGGDVAQDVAEEIGSDNDIESLRTADEVHGGSVNQQGLGFDVRVLGSYSLKNAIPENHAEPLRVGFRDGGDFAFLITSTGEVESVADDALDAVASENRGLHRDFGLVILMDEAADLRVFAFRVFTNDDHIHVAADEPFERRGHSSIQNGRPHIGELIEARGGWEAEGR